MNFVLRDDSEGGLIEARWGENYEGDGRQKQIAMNYGFPLGPDGFANFSAEFSETDPSSRSVQRADAAALIAAGNNNVLNPAQVWGTPEISDNFKFFGNTGLDLGNGREAYAFGNWAEREVEGGFFFRNPNTRGGINNGPIITDPLDPTATVDTILVADFTAGTTDDGIGCPVVAIRNNVPDPAALAAVAADPNCFAFNNIIPGGFTPSFGGDISDTSLVFGSRGDLGINEMYYDISFSVGRHAVDYFINNTINPNLARLEGNIPRSYKPGGYVQLERALNIDLSREVEVSGFSSPLNIAGGFEYRDEEFQIENGDPNSFFIDPDLAAQGFGIGSNGFPGFRPSDAGTFTRNSFAGYLDFEADVTDDLLLAAAIRYEDYEDFGGTTNGKIAARWQVADNFALRGSFSTGFRAPTVGQANVRNVTTAFTGGVLADEATLPPTNPISVQLGGRELEPEESVNFAFGALFDVGDLSVTVDYFNVEVSDRIALTTTQVLSAADIAALLAQGVTDASSFTGARFFTNDFDTTTQGIDLVMTYPLEILEGQTDISFVYNWTDTEVDSFNPTIIGATRVRQLEDNLPEHRFALTGVHNMGPFRGLLRVNYFGEYFEAHLDDGTLPIEADSEFTVDLELGWTFMEKYSAVIGAQNVLDNEPDDNPFATIVGAQFPVTSPMGFNGGFWYFRLQAEL